MIKHSHTSKLLYLQIPQGESAANAKITTMAGIGSPAIITQLSASRFCGRLFNFINARPASVTVCSKYWNMNLTGYPVFKLANSFAYTGWPKIKFANSNECNSAHWT